MANEEDDVKAFIKASGKGGNVKEDEKRSVSFAVEETEVNGEGEEMNDLVSDSQNNNGNYNKAMPIWWSLF